MFTHRNNDTKEYHNVGQLAVISKFRRKGIVGNYGWPQYTNYTSPYQPYNINNSTYPYPLDTDENRQICLNVHGTLCTEKNIYYSPCDFFFEKKY